MTRIESPTQPPPSFEQDAADVTWIEAPGQQPPPYEQDMADVTRIEKLPPPPPAPPQAPHQQAAHQQPAPPSPSQTPPAPEPFPWAQEIPGAPARPAPEPFPWAQEIPGAQAPPAPQGPPAAEPFPWAQQVPGTPPPGPEAVHPIAPPPAIDEPWRTGGPSGPKGPRRSIKKPLLIGAGGLAAVALVAAGVLVVPGLIGSDDDGGGAGAKLAGALFPVDAAARTDGRDQQVTGVAARGSTVVAVGGETDPQNSRGLFLVSSDGGRTFTSVDQQDTDGGLAPPGGVPEAVGASRRGWVAVGSRAGGGGAVWLSKDGKEWRRQPDAVGDVFGPHDRVTRIVGTGGGFLAVGENSPKGDFSDARPAVWLSSDGRRWEARVGDQIGLQVQNGGFSLVEAAANGDVILLEGLITPDSKKPGPYRKVWRSDDAGRTWSTSDVPAPKGSRGLMIGGGGGSGFLAMREMSASGKLFGQAFTSRDGRSWTRTGKLEPAGYQRTNGIVSDGRGFTAVTVRGTDVLLARTADGAAWKAASSAESKAGREVLGAAAAGGQTVLVGREPGGGDLDPMLGVWDANGAAVPVDLAKIPGAIRPDHAVRAVAATNGLTVAVGSASGDAAVWSSQDGASWKAAQGLGAAFTRPGPQQLDDVAAAAPDGWRSATTSPRRAAPLSSPPRTARHGRRPTALPRSRRTARARPSRPPRRPLRRLRRRRHAGLLGRDLVLTRPEELGAGRGRGSEDDGGHQGREPLDAGRHVRVVRVRRRRRQPGRQGQPPVGVAVAGRPAVDAPGAPAPRVRGDRGPPDPCRRQGEHPRGHRSRGHPQGPRLARLRVRRRRQDVASPGVAERRHDRQRHRAGRDPEGLRGDRHHRARGRDRRGVVDVRGRLVLAGLHARRHRPRRRRRPGDHRPRRLREHAARGGPQRRLGRRPARPVEPARAVTRPVR
ncbi:hypothetical protein ACFQY7_46045 [Actinomadura luteofluorescens]|uniref:hypothetical protein n=1 Tax=Actinomadura luteofluorescens TaxID=46163 RepID=UPI00362B7B8C